MIKHIFLTSSFAPLRYWTAIFLYLLILILGSMPGNRQEIGQVASGVVLHTLAYAGLTFLLFTGSKGSASQRAVKSVLTVAVMGAFDELLQSLFPYRHGAIADWLVDVNAAVLTALCMWVLWSRLRVQPSN